MLVAEDDPHDVFLLSRAFRLAGLEGSVTFVNDGQEAIDFFSAEPSTSVEEPQEKPIPDLLLLDLKMPRLNGFQVLEWLRTQPGLKRLPVIVFTSSTLSEDVNRAYDLGANSYVEKPGTNSNLSAFLGQLRQYWFGCNQAPDCHCP